jgi:hypothetical protein
LTAERKNKESPLTEVTQVIIRHGTPYLAGASPLPLLQKLIGGLTDHHEGHLSLATSGDLLGIVGVDLLVL